MTEEMLAKARAVIAESGLSNVEVRQGIIEDLPVESGSIDWVISNCVINLSPEKEKVFREIERVLEPGGRMIVSDIVAHDLPEVVRKVLASYGSCIADAISEEAYEAGLRRAGLAEVEFPERIEYEVRQLEVLVAAAIEGLCGSEGCDVQEVPSEARLAEVVAACDGKVWSAKILARKPE